MFQYFCFNVYIFLLLTEYKQKRFNTACLMLMSKKYLFLSLSHCSKVHFGLEMKSVEINFSTFGIV